MGTWLLLKEKCGEALLSFGLEKGADWLMSSLKRDAVESAMNTAIQKIASDFGEGAGYQLKLALSKNGGLRTKIIYKTQKQTKTVTAMKKAMAEEGSTHSSEIQTKICQQFIVFFHEELPRAEKASSSQTAANNETHRLLKDVLKEIRSSQAPSPVLPKTENTHEMSASTPLDSDEAEFQNSKYKQKIDEAKTLTDRQKYKSAKEIYLQLLKEFEADGQVPKLVRFKVYNNLGVCQRNLGEGPEASISFKTAFDILGPMSIVACKNRAVASMLDGKPLEGLPFIDAAIKLAPDDKDCIHIKAMLLSAAGLDDDALGLYGEPE